MAISPTTKKTIPSSWTLLASGAGVVQVWPQKPGSNFRVAFGADAVTAPIAGIVGDRYTHGERLDLTMEAGEYLYWEGTGTAEVNSDNLV